MSVEQGILLANFLARGIADLEQEDLTDKSNRDKTLLMEKLGAIRSAALQRKPYFHHSHR